MRSTILTAFIIATALFMENMDGTVLSTSLPAIARDFGEDPIVLKLALTSYMLTLAVFIPASGWVADRLGARTVFCSAIVVFTLGSILCGASSSLPTLIAARVFQGFGGAMMVPVGRLVLLRSVPKSDMVNALAYLTVPALIGPVLGPPLGGFITTYFHWRWIFWINVPIGLVGVLLSLKFIENVRELEVPRFDFRGFFLSGAGLLSLVFGLTVIGVPFVPRLVAGALVIGGLALLAAYVSHARREADAIIDLDLLKIRTFFAGVVGGFLFRIGIGAIPFLLPLLLQIGFGLTPFASGSLTFAAAAGALAMKFSAATIIRRFGFRRILVANCMISALFLAGCGLFTAADAPLAATGGAAGRRLLPLARIHRAQRHRLRRHQPGANEPRHQFRQRRAADVGRGRRRASPPPAFRRSAGVSATRRLSARDMTLSFGVVALITLSSVAIFARLKPDAGAEVSGQHIGDRGGGAGRVSRYRAPPRKPVAST